MAEDPIDYAGITVEDCDAAFTTVFALYDCLNEIKSLKYDVVTCNTITWLEFTSNNLQLEPPVPDFMPPPSAYFECYFKKTQMKNETKFKSEHKKACDNLYSNNQRYLLKCYDTIGVEYGLDEQIKICSEDFNLQSQIDELYECMTEFNVTKNEEYCSLNSNFVLNMFDDG